MAAEKITKKDIREFVEYIRSSHLEHSRAWVISDEGDPELIAEDARIDGAYAVLFDLAEYFKVKIDGINK